MYQQLPLTGEGIYSIRDGSAACAVNLNCGTGISSAHAGPR
jgi:hypothetical protein